MPFFKPISQSLGIILLLILCGCQEENVAPTGDFSYVVSGAASETISGTDTNFGLASGEVFISLIDGTNDLVIRIIASEIKAGTFEVNPVLVNNQPQTIEEDDAFADLGLGSTLNGDRRNFSTNAGIGGTVTISSVSDTELRGNFNIGMLELLSTNTPPSVDVQGQFKAVKK